MWAQLVLIVCSLEVVFLTPIRMQMWIPRSSGIIHILTMTMMPTCMLLLYDIAALGAAAGNADWRCYMYDNTQSDLTLSFSDESVPSSFHSIQGRYRVILQCATQLRECIIAMFGC
jgi:hypothetical protein